VPPVAYRRGEAIGGTVSIIIELLSPPHLVPLRDSSGMYRYTALTSLRRRLSPPPPPAVSPSKSSTYSVYGLPPGGRILARVEATLAHRPGRVPMVPRRTILTVKYQGFYVHSHTYLCTSKANLMRAVVRIGPVVVQASLGYRRPSLGSGGSGTSAKMPR
jgi:hypothetical protein